jgi:hypothetical protein
MTAILDYPKMVDEAMRGVVREALKRVCAEGLSGNHHFYISFNTRYAGVSISPQLLAKYPQEITIVVQHQYWDLEVYKHSFSVTLSFNNVPEKLVVPFDALTAFADPSVRFGLQFHQKNTAPIAENDSTEAVLPNEEENAEGETEISNTSKVISLDAFRKN